MSEFRSLLQLSGLDGRSGFRLSGEAKGDESGLSVAAAGDVNGDGFADVIIGAEFANPGGAFEGASYVVFGKGSGFASELALSSLNGRNGFQLSGEGRSDFSGAQVASAGDVNGDGFADLVIGAPFGALNDSGISYVVFGRAGGFPSNLQLSSLNGRNGFRLTGEATNDWSGSAVASAGDVNGDGFDDVIIGAERADAHGQNSGAAYVVFGKAGGFPARLALSSLAGWNGFKIVGAAAFDGSGAAVASAGDVNGDGFADVVIGAPDANANGPHSGASYVVFGKAHGFPAELQLSSLDGCAGFKISGTAAYAYSGASAASAGDVNGDGFADVVIGASHAGRYASGATYVVFGKAQGFAANFELINLNGRNGFRTVGEKPGDGSGEQAGSAGDVNGDGFADVVIGAPNADPNGAGSGASYVVFGKATDFPARLFLSSLDGSTGFKLAGERPRDFAGTSAAAAGDVNGDGFADVMVGARGADPHGSYSGASYVVFGHRAFDAVNRVGTALANTIHGGAGNDTIRGLDGDDRLIAWEGHDLVFGGKGRDWLSGRTGHDRLTGGIGRDVLIGGAGYDVFDFNAVTDSGVTEDSRDVIRDFTHAQDKIDLSDLGHLTFIGAAPFACPGQVRVVQEGPNTMIEINLCGDATPEMTIALLDVAAATLTAQDFIL